MIIAYLRFNSTLVRLRHITKVWKWVASIQFQFHIGSIKTIGGTALDFPKVRFNSTLVRLRLFVAVLVNKCDAGFNSTLVRLRPVSWRRGKSLKRCFNSTLVRLRPAATRRQPASRRRFNSTLVRLRRRCKPGGRVADERFQFHIGSIKTSKMRAPADVI